MLLLPYLTAEYEECRCLHIQRLKILSAWDVLERVVEWLALPPGEGLYALSTEGGVVCATLHSLHSLLDGRGADKWRCGVGKDVDVGIHLLGEGVVDLFAECSV